MTLSAEQQELISICIPTCNRPDLVQIAIKSCFAQDYRPLEILVGDDSNSDATSLILQSLPCPAGIFLNYTRNVPSLGQSANVNALFARASGARLALLHDDDLFCPDGLAALIKGWRSVPDSVCVFGRQVAVTQCGSVDVANTLYLDHLYERDVLKSGPQRSSIAAGLLQHLPNNCFLVKSELARKTLYSSEREVGQAVDADFGIRLGLNAVNASFVFVPHFVSAYRLTARSIARSADRNQDHHLIFEKVEEISVPVEDEPAKLTFLTRIGPSSVLDAANAGERQLACDIMRSPYFGKSALSPHSLVAAVSIAWPSLGRALRPTLKKVAKLGQAASITKQARLVHLLQHSRGGEVSMDHDISETLAEVLQIERRMRNLDWIRTEGDQRYK